ncbi:hypothetical protein DUNSADRAFT_16579 [Dunaliella salina]|uniref:Chromo domain-containing protein n=1 Tax=Dunaliella salina TaxID=3046 RepID=A0ABQ7H0V3_DUNSA|nr:hypothetical protein DUNSADRAFT_16579 [Dunaliella salina]|eukprot:KAF5840488.1 hypothetical protein DUNSADRAFT_16579 [Dunaliella salina]
MRALDTKSANTSNPGRREVAGTSAAQAVPRLPKAPTWGSAPPSAPSASTASAVSSIPRFILQPAAPRAPSPLSPTTTSSRLVVAAAAGDQQQQELQQQELQQQQQQQASSSSRPESVQQLPASGPSFLSLPQAEDTYEVDTLAGVRASVVGSTVRVEYLAKWKDGSPDTWEEGINLSEDLIRDYEDRWWSACRKGDFKTLASMLEGGRQVLSQVVNERGQSALHFAAALGKQDCVQLLLEAGADGNLQDKDGYTPLHMAAGYMHSNTMTMLLEAGLGVQIKDKNGKDVVSLIEDLRQRMPLNLATIMQRLKLEEVLAEQPTPDGKRELLCQFLDGRDDAWVHERDVSPEVIEDYEAGMEVAEALEVEDMVEANYERKFKVRWSDDYPDSWEPEDNVSADLIAAFFARKHPAGVEPPPGSQLQSSEAQKETAGVA